MTIYVILSIALAHTCLLCGQVEKKLKGNSKDTFPFHLFVFIVSNDPSPPAFISPFCLLWDSWNPNHRLTTDQGKKHFTVCGICLHQAHGIKTQTTRGLKGQQTQFSKAGMSETIAIHYECVLLHDCNLSICAQVMAQHDYKMSIMKTFTGHLKMLVFSNMNENLVYSQI